MNFIFRFDRVYVQYETSLFGTVQTNTYPLKKVINIQESRSFLTHLKDKLELINFAQSGHIIFQVGPFVGYLFRNSA